MVMDLGNSLSPNIDIGQIEGAFVQVPLHPPLTGSLLFPSLPTCLWDYGLFEIVSYDDVFPRGWDGAQWRNTCGTRTARSSLVDLERTLLPFLSLPSLFSPPPMP